MHGSCDHVLQEYLATDLHRKGETLLLLRTQQGVLTAAPAIDRSHKTIQLILNTVHVQPL